MSETVSVSEAGRRGGIATARKLTKQQRIESARKAAIARWTMRDATLKSCQVTDNGQNKEK
jgi:hypothetical protein